MSKLQVDRLCALLLSWESLIHGPPNQQVLFQGKSCVDGHSTRYGFVLIKSWSQPGDSVQLPLYSRCSNWVETYPRHFYEQVTYLVLMNLRRTLVLSSSPWFVYSISVWSHTRSWLISELRDSFKQGPGIHTQIDEGHSSWDLIKTAHAFKVYRISHV